MVVVPGGGAEVQEGLAGGCEGEREAGDEIGGEESRG